MSLTAQSCAFPSHSMLYALVASRLRDVGKGNYCPSRSLLGPVPALQLVHVQGNKSDMIATIKRNSIWRKLPALGATYSYFIRCPAPLPQRSALPLPILHCHHPPWALLSLQLSSGPWWLVWRRARIFADAFSSVGMVAIF